MEEKKPTKSLNETIFSLVDSVSPTVGKLILKKYHMIPFVVKDAVEDLYAAISKASDRDSIDKIKEALKNLKEACEANPDYNGVYEAAKKEAQDEIAEVVANEGMALFGEDE